MKSLFESLKEQMIVVESFSSEIVAKKVWPLCLRQSFIKRSYKWDKVTDDDFEKIENVDAALKLARKRTETNTILWIGEDDQPMALSVGFFTYPNVRFLDHNATTAEIARHSQYAYRLVDASKFDTTELRKARYESRENALALKNNEEVAKENMKRYQNLRAQINQGTKADVLGWYDHAMEVYNTLHETCMAKFRQLATNPEMNRQVHEIVDMFADLENAVGDIMKSISYWTTTDKELELAKQKGQQALIEWTASRARQACDRVKENCKDLEKKYAKYAAIIDPETPTETPVN